MHHQGERRTTLFIIFPVSMESSLCSLVRETLCGFCGFVRSDLWQMNERESLSLQSWIALGN